MICFDTMKKGVRVIVPALVLAISLVMSCRPNYEQKMRNLIGKELSFSSELVRLLPDSIDVSPFPSALENQKASIVFYFRSDECQTCIIEKIPDWAEKINEEFPDLHVFFIMPVSSSTAMELVAITKLIPNGSIVLDNHRVFSKENGFIPDEQFLRAWLVDSSGRILLVGNPADNPELVSLFRQEIEKLQ